MLSVRRAASLSKLVRCHHHDLPTPGLVRITNEHADELLGRNKFSGLEKKLSDKANRIDLSGSEYRQIEQFMKAVDNIGNMARREVIRKLVQDHDDDRVIVAVERELNYGGFDMDRAIREVKSGYFG